MLLLLLLYLLFFLKMTVTIYYPDSSLPGSQFATILLKLEVPG